jgi:hypothetical protein
VIGPSAIVFRILVLVVGRNGCIRSVIAHLWLLMKPPALSRRAEIPIDTRHPTRYTVFLAFEGCLLVCGKG